MRKLTIESSQLKERHDTLNSMNLSLQKKLATSKKKADQYDAVLQRCIQLEQTN